MFSYLLNTFSIKSILKTFFKPWRRLIGPKRTGIEGIIDVIVDNLVSRSVGVFLRTIVIFMFLITLVVYLIFVGISYIFWIGMPLWSVVVIFYALGVV